MWIRSQDKKDLIDASFFEIDSYKEILASTATVCDYMRIGLYETEKRALQVLDEIQQFIRDCHTTQNDRMFDPVFIMPES
jgi:uncharacterized protein (UPF0264 family)